MDGRRARRISRPRRSGASTWFSRARRRSSSWSTTSRRRPSIGAWISYGLGSENRDLPTFVAMISLGTGRPNDQPLYDRLWGSGFLPSHYQGVKFRGVGDPVLYLSNPPGVDSQARRQMLD